MYELKQVGERTYYIDSPIKVGIYQSSNQDVYLIDSGNDKNAGRRVKKVLDEQGWHLKGIINTHSHADHIGGNQYLQKQTGCKIFAKGMEVTFANHPILEAAYLYGGYPPHDLRHKFLMAAESEVVDICDEAFPKELEVLELPGHFLDMVGIRTPDDVVFLADSLASQVTLEKYQITFLYDIEAYLNTLKHLEGLKGTVFVPSHTEIVTDLSELIHINRAKVLEIKGKILDICKVPTNYDKMLQQLFNDIGFKMMMEQRALIGSTVNSYLSWLRDKGELEIEIYDNILYWRCSSTV